MPEKSRGKVILDWLIVAEKGLFRYKNVPAGIFRTFSVTAQSLQGWRL